MDGTSEVGHRQSLGKGRGARIALRLELELREDNPAETAHLVERGLSRLAGVETQVALTGPHRVPCEEPGLWVFDVRWWGHRHSTSRNR